jgi:uncharacterized protein YjiS (DUF1127 family)
VNLITQNNLVVNGVDWTQREVLKLRITKNSHSFWHEKTAKTHSFAKRGRAKARERWELATLSDIHLLSGKLFRFDAGGELKYE